MKNSINNSAFRLEKAHEVFSRVFKKIPQYGFLLLLCLTLTASIAQPIAATYLYTPDSRFGNGMNANASGSGHLLGGIAYGTFNNGLLTNSPMVVRSTSGLSTYPSPALYFNKTFEFSDPVSGNLLSATSNRVVELADGTGYISLSSFIVSRTTHPQYNNLWYGLLFMELDLNGNVVFAKKYVLPLAAAGMPIEPTDINVTALKQLTVNNPLVDEFVAVGQIFTNEATKMYLLKFDRNGNLFWGGASIFDFSTLPTTSQETPMDIIESPYTPTVGPATLGLCHIVGYIDVFGSSGTGRDPFVLTVDPATGTSVSQPVFFDFGGHDVFNSVTALTQGSDPGFALCGYNGNEILIAKMDINMSLQWAKKYQDLNSPTNSMSGNGIVGVWDASLGAYSLYVAGHNTYTVPRDITLLSVDDMGTPFGFDIIDGGGDEVAYDVDHNSSLGLRLYGNHINMSSQSYCLVNYGCIVESPPIMETPVNPNIYQIQETQFFDFRDEFVTLVNEYDNTDDYLCLAYIQGGNIFEGDEAQNQVGGVHKRAADASKKHDVVHFAGSRGDVFTEVNVYPNPVTDYVNINLKGIAATAVVIQNIQGATVGKAEIVGKNQYKFNAEGLAKGIYFIEVLSDMGNHVSKFIVK